MVVAGTHIERSFSCSWNDAWKTRVIAFALLALCAMGMTLLAVLNHSSRDSSYRFIVFGDWGRNGTDGQSEVANAMGVFCARVSCDFFVSSGDNFYDHGVASPLSLQWKLSYEDIYTNPSLVNIPLYAVLGNHDYQASVYAQLNRASVANDKRWKMPYFYYSQRQTKPGLPGISFFFLDSNPMIAYYFNTSGTEYPHLNHTAMNQGQRLIPDQLRALNDAFEMGAQNGDYLIGVGHHPLYSAGDFPFPSYSRYIQPYYNKYKVHAHLCGHEHNMQYVRNSTLFTPIFISGAGSELSPIPTIPSYRNPLVWGATKNGFLYVEVFSSQMQLSYYDTNLTVLYTSTIAHNR